MELRALRVLGKLAAICQPCSVHFKRYMAPYIWLLFAAVLFRLIHTMGCGYFLPFGALTMLLTTSSYQLGISSPKCVRGDCGPCTLLGLWNDFVPWGALHNV